MFCYCKIASLFRCSCFSRWWSGQQQRQNLITKIIGTANSFIPPFSSPKAIKNDYNPPRFLHKTVVGTAVSSAATKNTKTTRGTSARNLRRCGSNPHQTSRLLSRIAHFPSEKFCTGPLHYSKIQYPLYIPSYGL